MRGVTETDLNSILLAEDEGFAILTLNRPRNFNSLTAGLMDELARKLGELAERAALRVLIVTGAGGHFSAGADLAELAAIEPATALDFSRRGQAILAAVRQAAPVTIAAIDGYCLGGGLDLALSCDLRYATPASVFQHPGAKRGIITGWGGTQRLPRLIGEEAALRLLILGERISAGAAHRLGLITGIHADALGYAREIAGQIAGRFNRDELWTIAREMEQGTRS